ncbi:MAG: putative addiction module antidote protein [Deltaproteobacteria bacterium]|nr:putative addiction module antidote protein [Deltaproteobacteria bacterium]
MKRKPYVSHEQEQIKEFRKNPIMAREYLNTCFELAFEDDEPALILNALATVAKAFGMTRLAKKTRLQRESLHRMLSKKGNPEWKSLFQIFRALHLRPKLEHTESKSA